MEVDEREEGQWAQPRRVLLVTIEGLGTNLVGAYGNAICPTPNWDAFAVNSITSDCFWMDCPSTYDVLESICTGSHKAFRLQTGSDETRSASASHAWNGTGFQTPGLFVTDDPEACEVAERFLSGVSICVTRETTGPAETDFEYLLTKSFELWTERLESLPWLWIHSKGLSGPWDAPLEYRSRMCDEGDPVPPASLVPPDLWLEEDPDPDVAFGWSCGAGAQAISMDENWAWIDRFLREMSLLNHCLVVLAGVQGFPLGEHRRIGLGCAKTPNIEGPEGPSAEPTDAPESEAVACYAERLHVPLLMRPGNSLPLGWRLPQCIQPHQIPEWVEAWMSEEPYSTADSEQSDAGNSESDRVQSVSVGASGWSNLLARWNPTVARSDWEPSQRSALAIGFHDVALIVPSWSSRWIGGEVPIRFESGQALHRETVGQNGETAGNDWLEGGCRIPSSLPFAVPMRRVELYVYPEDRWQQNEVGDRAAAILEFLTPIVNAWSTLQEVGPEELERLLWGIDPSLTDPVR